MGEARPDSFTGEFSSNEDLLKKLQRTKCSKAFKLTLSGQDYSVTKKTSQGKQIIDQYPQ